MENGKWEKENGKWEMGKEEMIGHDPTAHTVEER